MKILLVIFSYLLLVPLHSSAQTSRTAEAMLSAGNGKSSQNNYEQGLTARMAEDILSSSPSPAAEPTKTVQDSSPRVKNTTQSVRRQSSTKPKRHSKRNKTQIIKGLEISLQGCKNVPSFKSITCDMLLTNLESTSDVMMYCYTGTSATGDGGNTIQCRHVWIGGNHSWNYAHSTLTKGTPVKAMIRLETPQPLNMLKSLEATISINGTNQTISMKNIAVH